MLLVSFGSPSAIGYATTNIARAVLDGCIGTHTMIHVIHLDDVKAKWQDTDTADRTAILITSDCPHLDVVSLCLSMRGPIVVSCDSFEHIVGYLMRSRDMTFAPASRLATQVVCALEALSRKPNVLRISGDDHERTIRDVAATLIAFTGLSADDEQFDAVLRGLGTSAAGPPETFKSYVARTHPHFSDDAPALGLSDRERRVLSTLSLDYDALTEGRLVADLSWPPESFCDGDRHGRPLTGPLDLLGPARCILYGPYLHLPIGRWRISIEIEMHDCLSDNRLGAEVVCGPVLAAVTMKLPSEGQRGFDLDFEIADSFLAVELRLRLLTGAIEGSVRLLAVRLSRKDGGDERGDRPSGSDTWA